MDPQRLGTSRYLRSCCSFAVIVPAALPRAVRWVNECDAVGNIWSPGSGQRSAVRFGVYARRQADSFGPCAGCRWLSFRLRFVVIGFSLVVGVSGLSDRRSAKTSLSRTPFLNVWRPRSRVGVSTFGVFGVNGLALCDLDAENFLALVQSACRFVIIFP